MADPRDAVVSLKQISIEFPEGTSEEAARQRVASFQQAVSQIRGCGEADSAAAGFAIATLPSFAAEFGAQVVSNEIAVRALPEALQSTILELNLGQSTPPFGSISEGVRVLMMCGRDDPAPTAAEPDRAAILSELEDERIGKRAQRYLRDLRRDAVIDYN